MTELINKVIFISNKKTSMRLAAAEWNALNMICERERIKRNHLLELINNRKDNKLGLTCSVRLFAIIYLYHLLTDNKQNYTSQICQIDTPIFDAICGIL